MQKYEKLIPLQCDVASRESLVSVNIIVFSYYGVFLCCIQVVNTIKEQQGYINVLINNSGVLYNNSKAPEPGDDIKAIQEKLWTAGTPEEFTKTFDVNVKAVYYASVAFLELLDSGNKRTLPADEPASQIITVSSIAGFRRDENTFSISYATSKAASTHMGKLLANTLKPWKIRSNIIVPGIYPSGMFVCLF